MTQTLPEPRKLDLPEPRLQLRWEWSDQFESAFGRGGWLCHYELVLPLDEGDVRREIWEDDDQVSSRECLVVALKEPSVRMVSVDKPPCQFQGSPLYYDPPYRDGMHAVWDGAVLGDLPIYVIAPDGTPLVPGEDRSNP